MISIHAPRTGSDTQRPCVPESPHHFNPRSPHGERLAQCGDNPLFAPISIHAPRTGSDGRAAEAFPPAANFNPRSPHGERLSGAFAASFRWGFQSTLPARGATWGIQHFVPAIAISIHAPRTGSDSPALRSPCPSLGFQSTLPARGATCPACTRRWTPDHFNPRSPHGERPLLVGQCALPRVFQSTLPARGATRQRVTPPNAKGISIHAPRTGSDQPFQPPPTHQRISIHAPRTGSDFLTSLSVKPAFDFNPRSPHGERLSNIFER